MTDTIYQKLARHLDDLPGGFPSTETGVELRILKRLFTPEEAELALCLTLIAEDARVVARRAGISRTEAEHRLEEMAKKGLIFRIVPKDGRLLYMASQYVIGIWEYHVNDLDPDFIRDMNEYVPTLVNVDIWKKAPMLRTVPVKRSLTPQMEVMSYEMAEELVRDRKKALVAPCICRRERRIMGEGCDKPEEACLVFDMGADYYQRNGLGRIIDKQEVLDILRKADKAGLVLQPGNAKKIVNICCCCGCCCGVLRTVKNYPRPADLVATAFIATADADTCNGCGVCEKRCQMDALRLEDEKVVLDASRCIGCGLCVSTCPTKSLTLIRKPESEQPDVPKNMIESLVRLGRERGKLGRMSLIRMQLKSKMDRLLAVKLGLT
ncbi:4Fe-4S binding protein [Desulfobacterales bacterium HSG2]|nr:4Fe-4S binding protein [Desulfobacterales bacterium HSG2]